ncbi:MAG: DUF445 family protein [Desulfopila sp.]
MLEPLLQFSPYLKFVAPPLVGAFIGYLTNKIAIRMLFRPLKTYRFCGIKLPMTPGVIPAKRHQLAHNIGDMVGGHLLTSVEISKALQKKSFQDQLLGLIRERVGGVLDREFTSLPRLVPNKYRSYFKTGAKTLAYQMKRSLQKYIASREFELLVYNAVQHGSENLLQRDIDSFADREKRTELYASLDFFMEKIFASKVMEQWIEDFLYSQVDHALKKNKTLQQILPSSLTALILSFVESRTPDILEKLAELSKDPEIQDRIVHGVTQGIDNFTKNLGPMGGMVKNFLKGETIEKGVKDYLRNNEKDIAAWLSDEKVRERITRVLLEKVKHYLNMPVSQFMAAEKDIQPGEVCRALSMQITAILQEESVAQTFSAMVQDNIEVYFDGGAIEVRQLLGDIAGADGVLRLQEMTAREVVALLRSAQANALAEKVVDRMIITILKRPIGKLSNIVPTDVREALYGSMQRISSTMLATEIPGLVSSLNIQQIVAQKVDSLDLLRLERLLLSIMEEQFKYINLFGALLGFLIGSLNVLLIYLI